MSGLWRRNCAFERLDVVALKRPTMDDLTKEFLQESSENLASSNANEHTPVGSPHTGVSFVVRRSCEQPY